jgi:hypothetical protein
MPRGPKSITAFIAPFAALGYAHAQEIGSAQQGLRLAQSQPHNAMLVEFECLHFLKSRSVFAPDIEIRNSQSSLTG